MSDYLGIDRSSYKRGSIDPSLMSPDPLVELEKWLDLAQSSAEIIEPMAMCISTVSPEGKPSSRFVLLRDLSPDGLTFFSNYESRKGRELQSNPFICATFWWPALEKQVRVEGVAVKTSKEVSDAYFHSRPRDSQVASAASPQSQTIGSREELEALVSKLDEAMPTEVARPEHWGGFVIEPERFEFWQGREFRLHDRIVYEREGEGWKMSRLAP